MVERLSADQERQRSSVRRFKNSVPGAKTCARITAGRRGYRSPHTVTPHRCVVALVRRSACFLRGRLVADAQHQDTADAQERGDQQQTASEAAGAVLDLADDGGAEEAADVSHGIDQGNTTGSRGAAQ